MAQCAPVPLGRLQQQRLLRAERRSDQPHQPALHCLDAHVHMLDDSAVAHARMHLPPPAFLLQGRETLEDNTFLGGETVLHSREIGTRVTGKHTRGFLLDEGAEEPRDDSHRCHRMTWYNAHTWLPLI
jgi:hypothetical protein